MFVCGAHAVRGEGWGGGELAHMLHAPSLSLLRRGVVGQFDCGGPRPGVAISEDSAHSASMDGLFSYALWMLVSLIAIGSGIALLVW
jgi:hypothetical protein